jgi:hypothetical protein
MRNILTAVFIALSATAAHAQTQPFALPATVGLASSVVAAANPNRKKILFVNPNPVAKVAVCPVASRLVPSTLTCTVGGAGSITLLPYASFMIEQTGASAVATSWNGISDTAASALTIYEFE